MTAVKIGFRQPIGRRGFIGGSDARIIMGNDEAALVRLWREKRGEAEPEDLSGNLIVQLGLVTEALNRHWFERNTGQTVECVQYRLRHPVLRWMGGTLDGIVAGSGAVFEAKFMLPWSFSEQAAAEKHLSRARSRHCAPIPKWRRRLQRAPLSRSYRSSSMRAGRPRQTSRSTPACSQQSTRQPPSADLRARPS